MASYTFRGLPPNTAVSVYTSAAVATRDAGTTTTGYGAAQTTSTTDNNGSVTVTLAVGDWIAVANDGRYEHRAGGQAVSTSGATAGDTAEAETAASGAYITVVSHGSTAGTARPTGAVRVFWLGSVQPTNAAQYDRWINTGVTPYTESIYNGSTWTALGGSGSVGPKTVTTVAASGATQTLALDTGNADRWYNVTLSANCAFTMPTPVVGAKLVLWLVQDATGNRTASWDSTVKWSAGAAPSLSSAAGKADRLEFECWKTGVWAGALTDLDSR